MSVSNLQKSFSGLAIKFNKDLKNYWFIFEIESCKFETKILVQNIETTFPRIILQVLHDFALIV